MSYKLYSDEEKRLQRKLIPLNIVVALLALVAAISLIITPILKIDIAKIIPAIVSEASGSTEDKNSEGESSDGSESAKNDETAQLVAAMFDGVDAVIELSPLDMARVLIAPENEKGAILIDALFVKNGLVEQVSASFINAYLATKTEAMVDAEDFEKLDLETLNDALLTIDKAQSSDEVVEQLDDYLKLLEEQLDFEFTDEQKASARETCVEVYDTTVEATGGSFSVEEMICVHMSPEGGEVYTSYSDLIIGMANGDFDSDESTSGIADYAQMLNQIAAPYGYAFIFVAFHVLMWFILFLFAFFRIFAKNKRFTMWYVKLVSCWPCIIFFLAPLAMTVAAAGVGLPATFVTIFSAVSSMTWISGICYLLLWVFSICWAFPIKHKIRKLRKGK